MVIFARSIVRYEAIKDSHVDRPERLRNGRFDPFFRDCVGAVDGSHFNCLPPSNDTEVYRNRKGQVSINVMFVVSLRGRFTYVFSGWEGSAHDWKVFLSAVEHKFTIPSGKFLLGDAGYAASHRVLTPYRG